MKKILPALLFLLTFNVPFAIAKSITIQWNIPTSTVYEIQDYILYYSSHANMDEKIKLTCDQIKEVGTNGDRTNFSMACYDVPIVTGETAYFTLEAIKNDGSSLSSDVFTKDTKISKVLNFKILTPTTNVPPSAAFIATPTSGTAPLKITLNANESSDPDGTINSFTWNFGDGTTGSGVNADHIFTSAGTYTVTLIVKDDKGATAQSSTTIKVTSGGTNESYAINFQPADAPVPTGFLVDSGESFDATRGYGWPVSLGPGTFFDQNSSVSPDQAYDTLTNSTNTSAYWELALPQSGNYHVTLCMGDPRNSYGRMKAQVEGVSIIDDQLSSTQRWIVNSADINVTDGKLTLTFTGTDRVQVCWIKVEKN